MDHGDYLDYAKATKHERILAEAQIRSLLKDFQKMDSNEKILPEPFQAEVEDAISTLKSLKNKSSSFIEETKNNK